MYDFTVADGGACTVTDSRGEIVDGGPYSTLEMAYVELQRLYTELESEEQRLQDVLRGVRQEEHDVRDCLRRMYGAIRIGNPLPSRTLVPPEGFCTCPDTYAVSPTCPRHGRLP